MNLLSPCYVAGIMPDIVSISLQNSHEIAPTGPILQMEKLSPIEVIHLAKANCDEAAKPGLTLIPNEPEVSSSSFSFVGVSSLQCKACWPTVFEESIN
jgi:hypothetical protein